MWMNFDFLLGKFSEKEKGPVINLLLASLVRANEYIKGLREREK